MSNDKPKLVCFSCKFGWGYLESNDKLAATVTNWIPIACSGKVDSTHIVSAFKNGADGVLILGCPAGECHFQDGNTQTRKRVALLQKMVSAFGIEPARLKFALDLDPDGKKIPAAIDQMGKDIAKLGALKIRNSVVA
jgi:F420-non-reducing hydrogenase iron-sulfur subunit